MESFGIKNLYFSASSAISALKNMHTRRDMHQDFYDRPISRRCLVFKYGRILGVDDDGELERRRDDGYRLAFKLRYNETQRSQRTQKKTF